MKDRESEDELKKEEIDGRKEEKISQEKKKGKKERNKAGYTATEVASEWAGAIFEVTRPFGQEQ